VIDDPMDAQLAALDPSRREAPPAPGSVRHASILERAMSGTGTTPLASVPASEPARRRRRRPRHLGAAAAAMVVALVVVVACAAVLLRGPDDPDPISVVSSAADTTAEVTSFRVTLDTHDQYSDGTGTIEVDGDRMRVQVSGTYRDGPVEGSTTVYIGLDSYEERLDGGRETARLDQPMAPFGSASQAVLAAALSGHDVAVAGQETVRGVPATHYRIILDDASRTALADLGPEMLGWFGLVDPDQVRTIDVWVGGDLIRRLRVQSLIEGAESVRTAEYYDFGAAIHIQPPDWAGQ
jgi:hypothetical protein